MQGLGYVYDITADAWTYLKSPAKTKSLFIYFAVYQSVLSNFINIIIGSEY